MLDFAPLVREFYRRSRIEENLVSYTRAYQAEGDRLRKPTAEMVRAVLSYLHTRPITVSLERVLVKAPTTGQRRTRPRRTRLASVSATSLSFPICSARRARSTFA